MWRRAAVEECADARVVTDERRAGRWRQQARSLPHQRRQRLRSLAIAAAHEESMPQIINHQSLMQRSTTGDHATAS